MVKNLRFFPRYEYSCFLSLSRQSNGFILFGFINFLPDIFMTSFEQSPVAAVFGVYLGLSVMC